MKLRKKSFISRLLKFIAITAVIVLVLTFVGPHIVLAIAKQERPADNYNYSKSFYTTYEEVRAILAEKSRTGFRAEVKAILTKHGVAQLSDVKDPSVFAAIVAEAEEIKVG